MRGESWSEWLTKRYRSKGEGVEQGTRSDEKERELVGEGGEKEERRKAVGQKRTGGKERCGLRSCLSQSRGERFAMRKTRSPKNSRSSTNFLLKTLNSRL